MVRNGVDTHQLFATLDLLTSRPELGRFRLRASNRWIDGTHNRSTIRGFHAVGAEDTSRAEPIELDAGAPAVLLGTDTGATPAEHLLHALAADLTTAIVYVAAARRVDLGVDRLELHAARRGDVDDCGGQVGGERVQEVLGGRRAGVGAEQHRRRAGVELERLVARGVLRADGVEAADRRAVVRAVDPAVVGAEPEVPELRPGSEEIERGEQLMRVHAVADHGVVRSLEAVG